VYKIRLASFFLPVITQVINLNNGVERHHLLLNTVGQNSCPLIFENNHSKFSVICVRFMYKYLALCYFFLFLIRRRLSFLKTFFVSFNYMYNMFAILCRKILCDRLMTEMNRSPSFWVVPTLHRKQLNYYSKQFKGKPTPKC